MKFRSLGQRLFSLIRRQWACLSRVLHSAVMLDFHLICLCEGGHPGQVCMSVCVPHYVLRCINFMHTPVSEHINGGVYF